MPHFEETNLRLDCDAPCGASGARYQYPMSSVKSEYNGAGRVSCDDVKPRKLDSTALEFFPVQRCWLGGVLIKQQGERNVLWLSKQHLPHLLF
jgi:hypothetical protein